MVNKLNPREGHRAKAYQPWSTETCVQCDKEGYASRAYSWTGIYVCPVCEAYAQGYNDALDAMEKEINDGKKP